MYQNQSEDIFDKLMHLPILHWAEPFYEKHKSVLLYLFFGGITTVVSIGSFVICEHLMDVLLANIVSWICAVLFAYVTNRIWVFSSVASGCAIMKECLKFMSGRVATLVVEELVLFVFVTVCNWNSLFVKIVAQIVVMILNYFVSKYLVFRKKSDCKE